MGAIMPRVFIKQVFHSNCVCINEVPQYQIMKSHNTSKNYSHSKLQDMEVVVNTPLTIILLVNKCG